MPEFPSFPEQASALAGQVDLLLYVLMGFGAAFTLLIFVIVLLNMRERQEDDSEPSKEVGKQSRAQIVWAVVGVLLLMALFVWSEQLYLSSKDAPDSAKDVTVVGKRWLWKFQHYPDGQSEIDELHVAVGEPVRLTMTSQDVIHSLSIPAFRVQKNVIPGRFTTLWFEATEAGEYEILSAEYSGTDYTNMIGKVIAELPDDHEVWLGGGLADLSGEELWGVYGCAACHIAGGVGGEIGPSMDELYGSEQTLESGETVIADEDFLYESILNAGATIIAGYPAAMPSYEGQISDEEVAKLIDYIKSLSAAGAAAEPEISEEVKQAQEIYLDNGCDACHGAQLEGLIGPALVGLDPDFLKETVRSGRSGSSMLAYNETQISDEELELMAQAFATLPLSYTGITLSEPVLDALAAALEAADANDKAGVRDALEEALDAADDAPEGVKKTLAVMITNLSLDNWADYIANRLSLLTEP
jgi:cytochrome c oxidase subunit 2